MTHFPRSLQLHNEYYRFQEIVISITWAVDDLNIVLLNVCHEDQRRYINDSKHGLITCKYLTVDLIRENRS